ncbi:LysR substrate-binding domain-containing protein [Anderseniella sp. Alg231-50]|uniref:LysR substrate-binding domain-containing protein n=1 Tax=Anderseniella sp. Alg231-50 TaxID=1922226 RepID=UPI000D560301
MDWRSVKFDWNRARAFLVTAEEGSLSAAARALGMAQPTLGRQVRAFEEEVGVLLFERIGNGLKLTTSGLELVEHVRVMGEAAGRVSLTASGQSQQVEGPVCITATEVAAAYILPPIVAKLRAAEPGITVEVVATNNVSDLRRREADIAIRSGRPTDPDLIARMLRSNTASLYASENYLERIGNPQTSEELLQGEFMGFEQQQQYIDGLNQLGLKVTSQNFPVICNNHIVQWQMVKQGIGIGVMISQVGDAEPGVRLAAPWLPAFEIEVWLVAHRELNTSRRVRLVFDFLAGELESL